MEGILLHYPLQERYRKVKHGKKTFLCCYIYENDLTVDLDWILSDISQKYKSQPKTQIYHV